MGNSSTTLSLLGCDAGCSHKPGWRMWLRPKASAGPHSPLIQVSWSGCRRDGETVPPGPHPAEAALFLPTSAVSGARRKLQRDGKPHSRMRLLTVTTPTSKQGPRVSLHCCPQGRNQGRERRRRRDPDHLSRAFPDVAFTGRQDPGEVERLGESPVGPGAGWSQEGLALHGLCAHTLLCAPALGVTPAGSPSSRSAWGSSGVIQGWLAGYSWAHRRLHACFSNLRD